MEALKNLSSLSKILPPGDFLIILGIFLFLLILGLFWGKKRILALILILYLARLLTDFISLPEQFRKFSLGNFFTGKLFLFWGLFLLLLLVLSASGFSLRFASRTKKRRKKPSLLQTILYSLLAGGLLVSLSLTLVPTASLVSLSSLSFLIFASPLGKIIWLLMPLVAMVILK